MPDPGTPEFIAKYPFQIQEYRPYRNWVEFRAHNFKTAHEADTIANYLRKTMPKKKLRVVDMRSGIVVPRMADWRPSKTKV